MPTLRLTPTQARALGLGGTSTRQPSPQRPRKRPELVTLPDGRVQVLGHVYRIAGAWATCELCGLGMAVRRLPQWGGGYWHGG